MKKNNTAKRDSYFLKKALLLAKRSLGLTYLRPAVGCMIVDDNYDIVTATCTEAIALENSSYYDAFRKHHNLSLSTNHTITKSPLHAEETALKRISIQTKLTVYITLEPCNFRSDKNKKSCLDIILANKNKIKRVVIGMIDPNPKINGSSIAKLQSNGISVDINSCDNKITDFYQGYQLRYCESRPKVCLKLATDINGKLGVKHKSLWLSNQLSVQYSHYLRARSDAILVGSNTLRVDKPKLNVRLNDLEVASPIKVLLISTKKDLNLIPLDSNTIVFYDETIKLNSDDLRKLKPAYKLFAQKKEKNKRFNLAIILTFLAKLGISNLLLEGGAKLASSFLKYDLVDEIQIITSPSLLRYEEKELIASFDCNIINNHKLQKFNLFKSFQLNQDVINIYNRKLV